MAFALGSIRWLGHCSNYTAVFCIPQVDLSSTCNIKSIMSKQGLRWHFNVFQRAFRHLSCLRSGFKVHFQNGGKNVLYVLFIPWKYTFLDKETDLSKCSVIVCAKKLQGNCLHLPLKTKTCHYFCETIFFKYSIKHIIKIYTFPPPILKSISLRCSKPIAYLISTYFASYFQSLKHGLYSNIQWQFL